MLNSNSAPDGFTKDGMERGWMRRKKNPTMIKLQKENRELKETLAAILERLEKLEEKTE